MFYDIYLDEFLYLREEKFEKLRPKPDLFKGLIKYTKNEINNYMNGKVKVLMKAKDLDDFIKISRNVLSNNDKFYYGKLNQEITNKINRDIKKNLSGFNLSLQVHNLKHIQKKHGNPIKEITRGQLNITDYDYFLIPTIVSEYDLIKLNGYTESGNQVLKFIKQIDNNIYNLIIYISYKKHNLEIKTFYKKKKRTFAKV